jgi:hypothetical protein
MQFFDRAGICEIEFDGFEAMPTLRRDLIAFLNVVCADMTLAQAREWYDQAFAIGSQTAS